MRSIISDFGDQGGHVHGLGRGDVLHSQFRSFVADLLVVMVSEVDLVVVVDGGGEAVEGSGIPANDHCAMAREDVEYKMNEDVIKNDAREANTSSYSGSGMTNHATAGAGVSTCRCCLPDDTGRVRMCQTAAVAPIC